MPAVPAGSNVISIAHINDVHSHYSPFNKLGNACTDEDRAAGHCFGGAARLATVFQALKKRNPNNTYSMVAGDEFQGTDYYSRTKGNISAEVMNYMDYDLMTTGNHEFDDGPVHLAKFFNKLHFPKVCANANFSGVPELDRQVKPYHIFERHNLAVIGYITNTTGYISNAGPLISFSNPAPAVQRVIDELHAKGIKRIIALSHNGYNEDKEVAALTQGLSLIVGGHSHTYLSPDPDESGSGGLYPTVVKGTDGLPTYVVQAKAWGEYIGILDLIFNDEGRIANLTGVPIHLTQDIPEERRMAQMVADWRVELDKVSKKLVGRATADFDQESCQARECTAGDLVADSMLYYHRTNPNVRAAIINAGGVRAGIQQGNILMENVDTVLPFSNFIMDIELTGRAIRQMFEDVLAKKNQQSGKTIATFIQVSGLIVEYDPSREAYNRVVSLKIRKAGPISATAVHPAAQDAYEPVQPDTTYTLVTLDYIINGGDGIFAAPPKAAVGHGTPAEAMVAYLQDAKVMRSPAATGAAASTGGAGMGRRVGGGGGRAGGAALISFR
ncbi:Metallo-dependent phosphatase-like protein [Syncephalis pseudoplumigaleata]|uniref:Metallo-dependent phosphatase-like protein n=1 Tax=Syncephalis pseudoplumigaleata TaxID=1712513 RepID=A0A4P9Z6R9_9FUNG|nr:Metallo-dependent phosphatase-like protein [Syncephalis pseudoplumigaleata]|eukprot:RKP27872.1 Metallo-dependent phosphatase-like protein [Syncephalis pseudoplumigaleata]